MRQIELTQGQVAVVDDADYEVLSKHRWHAQRGKGTWYARRNGPAIDGRRLPIWMHHEILAVADGLEVDHIDGDGLNNRRSNLREADDVQQGANKRNRKHSSRFKGVSWDQRKKRWRASIRVAYKLKNLGRFAREEDAARAYDEAAITAFGRFARLNLSAGG